MKAIKTESWLAQNAKDFFNECDLIASNEDLFLNFKRNEIFCTIVGNDVRDLRVANDCYNKIVNSNLIKDIEKFKENDLHGNPIIIDFPKIGKISIGTLYFLFILNDILIKLGDIKDFNIIEIGTGYGGQAKIILDYGIKNYTCLDVTQPLKLCKKYLNLFNYKNINFINFEEISKTNFINYDLVISNWCLSEFDIEGINFYIEKIIKKCKYGYFLINAWDEERKNFIKSKLENYFDLQIFPEEIQTHPSGLNYLLTIKNKNI